MNKQSTLPGTPIKPPFTRETALQKVRAAENAWNSRDPVRVNLSYSIDSEWRNRGEFIRGREQIVTFLERKWEREREYRLVKELWGFLDNRMAVRFQYEWQDASGQWHRSYGNELWEFDAAGLMRRREASINDLPIAEAERRFRWSAPGPRPETDPGIPAVY
ncbi:MAG: nuclear transport factor 2 family protein [Phycisphaerales bacterium]|nr:nuclear transport factor 2 family protein [Planctomycetota bacterium]